MPKLAVITVSTRPGRAGEPIVKWFVEAARAHGKFEVTPIDLREVALPLFDETEHPRFRKYEHAHTKRWSALIDPADAFVFVTPEYNYGPPPSLVNALDFLSQEWNYKAASFVGYGGVSGGTRAVQLVKPMMLGLKMVPISEMVPVPMFTQHIKDGVFDGGHHQKAANAMLDELHKWNGALQTLRVRA